MAKKLRHLALGFMIVFAACVTVNIYFPAAAIQKAADEIVDDVRGTKDEKQLEQKKNDKQSSIMDSIRGFIGPREVHAQINIEVSTPAIRSLLDRGAIGENNMGLLEQRDAGSLNLKEKADLNRFVGQENNNRSVLYSEIMKANKLGADSLPKIQRIFANSWRGKSQPGWWIQNDAGGWEKKR